MNYFEVKVSFEKVLENGTEKTVSEKYLLKNAMSFTEAESIITEYITPFVSGEYMISEIRRSKITETVGTDLEKYFKFKVAFISVNESGKEKRTNVAMLVNADNIDDAKSSFVDFMKSTMADYIITDISETKIVDVI